ncbi:MAG: nucleotidyltransferase domain-containing protein [Roseburia sp.]|nr:nucleotidyltransferase domain-containing protein [Roseburia sp.]
MKTKLQKITQTVVKSVVELLEDEIYKIVLYGSYARGDFDTESDIDIIILLNCDEKKLKFYRKEITLLASQISLENDIEVSLLLKSRETFESRRSVLSFYHNSCTRFLCISSCDSNLLISSPELILSEY